MIRLLARLSRTPAWFLLTVFLFCLPSLARAQATLVEVHFTNSTLFVKEDAGFVKAKVTLNVSGGNVAGGDGAVRHP